MQTLPICQNRLVRYAPRAASSLAAGSIVSTPQNDLQTCRARLRRTAPPGCKIAQYAEVFRHADRTGRATEPVLAPNRMRDLFAFCGIE